MFKYLGESDNQKKGMELYSLWINSIKPPAFIPVIKQNILHQ